jgi:predicted Zn finger-like uncharacterized protein
MKVGCQQCGAAYSVADEKVIGRKLRLRCKKCGEPIQVDGLALAASPSDSTPPEAEAAAPAEDVASTPAARPDTLAEWHVAIGDTTQGPYTLLEIAEYYADGNILLDTLVYRDGWPDWVQAGEISELQQAAAALRRAPAAPAPAVQVARVAGGNGHSIGQVAMGSDPFAEAMAQAASPRLSASDMNSRHEGTVQFSVDQIRALSAVSSPNLVPVAPARAAYAAGGGYASISSSSYSTGTGAATKPGYASGEGSGLIDVASLVQAAQSQAEASYRPITGSSFSPLDTMAPVALPVVARVQSLDLRTKVYASLAALGLVLTGGLGVLAITHRPAPVAGVSVGTVSIERTAPQPVATAQPMAPAERMAHPSAQAEAPAAQEVAAAERKPATAAAEARRERASTGDSAHSSKTSKHTVAATSSAKRDDGERASKASDKAPANKTAKSDSDFDDLLGKGPSKEKASPAKKGSAGPSIDDVLAKDPPKKKSGSPSIDDLLDGAVGSNAKKTPPKAEAAEPKNDLPQAPSRDAMLAALNKAKAKVQSCKGSGVATANITIAGSGRVSNVVVSGVDGGAKSCVESAVRGTSFPKFQKDSFEVKYPFKLKG